MAAVAATALVFAACGDDDADDGSPDVTAGDADVTETGSDDTTTAETGEPTVMVANDAELGDYLVDSEGFTVYVFALDEGTTTACVEGCVDIWPPVVAAEPAAGDGVDAVALSTADGIVADHVTYHGQLLYLYAGDPEPGVINGTDIAEWYAVAPDGSSIGAAPAGATSPESDEGETTDPRGY